MMHPHYRANFPLLQAQRPKCHVNPVDGCQCSNELRAQLNRTNDQKGKNTIPASMACAWNPHVAIVCQTLEQQLKLKGMLAQLQSTNP